MIQLEKANNLGCDAQDASLELRYKQSDGVTQGLLQQMAEVEKQKKLEHKYHDVASFRDRLTAMKFEWLHDS